MKRNDHLLNGQSSDDISGRRMSRRQAHLLGAGGAGMRSLARLLREECWSVTGSDVQPVDDDPTICVGHNAENIPPDVQLVIASDAVPQENCERLRAIELGLPVMSYAEMLGRLSSERQTVAIAGTHGKSTTTAMLASILRAAGQCPSVVLGAEPITVGRASRLTENEKAEPFVVEACEYNRNFLRLNPNVAVILGVEHDHFSCYDSFDAVKQAFSDFARRVPTDGILVVNGDCPTAVAVTSGLDCRRILVGSGANCDWRLTEVTSHEGKYSAAILEQGKSRGVIRLGCLGRHNLSNALAAAVSAICLGETGLGQMGLGVSDEVIARGLADYQGLRRRLEHVATIRGVQFYEDYAHHPTAVAAGLASLREVCPENRLWLLFQPHQALRTERLLEPFAQSLQNADKVVVVPVYQARAASESAMASGGDLGKELSQRLTARAKELGVDAIFLDETDFSATRATSGLGPGTENLRRNVSSPWKNRPNLAKWVAEAIGREELTPGDVVVSMGAGNIGKVIHDVSQRF